MDEPCLCRLLHEGGITMKIDRLIGILSILLQQDKVTAPELAETFEVSRRTISRDIDALCRAGIPVATAQGAGGGISILEGYKVDRTVLTSAEMGAILAGLRSLDSISGTSRYAQLMEKLSAGASTVLAGNSHILINLASWGKAEVSEKIEALHTAIETSRTVRFHYYSPNRESDREIEPYNLVFQWSSWYVWGWCRSREDFRLFKLKRMTRPELGESFEKRGAPLPDLSTERVFPALYRVKAIIEPQHKWRLVEEYGPACFTVQDNGKLLFSFSFADRDSVIRYMVSFGDGAELLEPAGLRVDVAAFAEGILKKYRKT